MLPQVKRGLSGGLNTDDSAESIGQNQYINASAFRFGTKRFGDNARQEMIESTRLIAEGALPVGTNLPMGRCVDTARDRVFLFRWNSNGNHAIYVVQKDETVLVALKNSDTVEGLKFDKDMPIHSIRVYGDMLYWVNDNSEPFRVNIEAAIKANNPSYVTTVAPYVFPIAYTVYTLIRKPVNYILEIEKVTDVTVLVNQIEAFGFRFCAQLEYRDGEISTLSPQSLLANCNYPGETLNAIDVRLPFSEIISQDVRAINFIVVYANENKFFKIRTWDKSSAADLIQINAHNAGTTKLTYRFTNATIGEAIADSEKVKPFDSVPISARAMEIAKNRLHLGNTVLGYNTPTRSSLAFAVQSLPLTNIPATWEYWDVRYTDATYRGGLGGGTVSELTVYAYVVYVPIASGSVDAGYYYNATQPTPPTPPLPVAISLSDFTSFYQFMGATGADARIWLGYQVGLASWSGITNLDADRDDTVIGAGGSTTFSNSVKCGAAYQGGIVFFDRFMRQCGVFDAGRFTTAERSYTNLAAFNFGIGWTLSNTNRLLEIPTEAFFYSVVMTKCQTTNFFLSSRATDINYSTYDLLTNTYSTTSLKTYAVTQAAIAIHASLLYGYGLGYAYEVGDICKIHLSTVLGTVFYRPIKAVQGDWIIVDLADLGSLTSAICLFEIFTPLQADNANRTYYEVGNINPVVLPGTASRAYSVLNGLLPGDVFVKTRIDGAAGAYYTENMNPNDKVWKQWTTNHGRPQFVDRIGQVAKKTAVSFSNIAIPGTQTNGLSSFEALNEKVLTSDMVALRKLILTTKVQEEGTIMLAWGEDEIISLYLGESQINDTSGSVFVAQSIQVLGSDNALRGSYGTRHPESIAAYEGMVFGLDITKGKVIQYSNAGLQVVSDYKNRRFWHSWCSAYKKVAPSFWTTTGQRTQILGNIDEFSGEYQLTLPALMINPVFQPFDIFDKARKTMVFNFLENKWVGSFPYFAESAWSINDIFYSVGGFSIYAHDVNSGTCTLYGVAHPARISVQESAGNFDATKVWQTITVIGKAAPDNVTMESYLPWAQQTTLVKSEFEDIEGKFFAGILKNTISDVLAANIALNEGEDMRSQTLYVYLEYLGMAGTATRQNRIFINSIIFGINFSHGQPI